MKRDLSRKTDAVGARQFVVDMTRDVIRTFHDTGFVDRELESFFPNLNVRFWGECDTAKQ